MTSCIGAKENARMRNDPEPMSEFKTVRRQG